MKVKLKRIEEQVVVVMGASRGMGRETARRFAQRGAKVIVAARSEEGLRTLVEEIQQLGGSATSVVADVTDFAQVKAVADAAVTTYGRLDTWVHFVGISAYGRLDELPPEEFKRIIDVNLTGSAYGAMAALPHLRREGRGALIMVSSGLGKRGIPLVSAYCASKHGMIGWIDALRVELAHDRVPISVTNVMPSSINTPFFNTARTRMGVKPRPVPPTYDPALAADMILHAAQHPVRDLTVGGAATGLILAQRLMPRAVDFYLTYFGFGSQRTEEPKGPDAPSNLFRPVEGENRVRGDFGAETHERSLLNWLQRHPWARRMMAAGAFTAVAALAGRKVPGS